MANEADTCRKFVVPKLQAAGWDAEPYSIAEQRTITDGRIVPVGKGFVRRPPRKADYLLRVERNFTLAVVEAKADWKSAGDGLQQAKEYAGMLGLKFAYATNGTEIIEFDYFTGRESIIPAFSTPTELWARYRTATGLTDDTAATQLLTPLNHAVNKGERYYQETAINRTVEGLLKRRRRQLLTMATGTGKTVVAFQICWKLWTTGWNRTGEHRKPKILYLADRNILIDDPKDKEFAQFGDARFKIEHGAVNLGREMYFAIYQALAKDANRPGLYREYPHEFNARQPTGTRPELHWIGQRLIRPHGGRAAPVDRGGLECLLARFTATRGLAEVRRVRRRLPGARFRMRARRLRGRRCASRRSQSRLP